MYGKAFGVYPCLLKGILRTTGLYFKKQSYCVADDFPRYPNFSANVMPCKSLPSVCHSGLDPELDTSDPNSPASRNETIPRNLSFSAMSVCLRSDGNSASMHTCGKDTEVYTFSQSIAQKKTGSTSSPSLRKHPALTILQWFKNLPESSVLSIDYFQSRRRARFLRLWRRWRALVLTRHTIPNFNIVILASICDNVPCSTLVGRGH
jgi:hypothetical protein